VPARDAFPALPSPRYFAAAFAGSFAAVLVCSPPCCRLRRQRLHQIEPLSVLRRLRGHTAVSAILFRFDQGTQRIFVTVFELAAVERA